MVRAFRKRYCRQLTHTWPDQNLTRTEYWPKTTFGGMLVLCLSTLKVGDSGCSQPPRCRIMKNSRSYMNWWTPLKVKARRLCSLPIQLIEIFALASIVYTVFRWWCLCREGFYQGYQWISFGWKWCSAQIEATYSKKDVEIGRNLVGRDRLCHNNPEFDNISFSLRKGEILSVYGFAVGSGRTEVMQAYLGTSKSCDGLR